ncbi:MAG: hypothetical protein ACYS1A_19450 [Planctomycetota bacterium]|jgi:hypothetical protein
MELKAPFFWSATCDHCSETKKYRPWDVSDFIVSRGGLFCRPECAEDHRLWQLETQGVPTVIPPYESEK